MQAPFEYIVKLLM